jgi:hypothetical protein
LYALSEPTLDAICSRVPDFFSPEEKAFERDLARAAAFGFSYHRALGSTPELAERQTRAADQINELMTEELRQVGIDEGAIDQVVAKDADRREWMGGRQEAYMGWLITNQQYRSEVRSLRDTWGPAVQKLGAFPRLPRWPFFLDESIVGVPQELCQDFFSLYCRWGLDQLLTWDWPVPMEPELAGGVCKDLDRLSQAGLVLVIPWYLLRGEKLNLQEVIQVGRTVNGPDHLRD